MKILTVEDDQINAMLMERVLMGLEFGFDHEIAANADEAIEITGKENFDLILMDINLGPSQMSGVDVMKNLREKKSYKGIPIYAVTCYALPGDKERFLDEGFDRYFSKPVNHNELLKAITEDSPNGKS